jgi:hypothetical protein
VRWVLKKVAGGPQKKKATLPVLRDASAQPSASAPMAKQAPPAGEGEG